MGSVAYHSALLALAAIGAAGWVGGGIGVGAGGIRSRQGGVGVDKVKMMQILTLGLFAVWRRRWV